MSIRLTNVYAPIRDKPTFFQHLRELIEENEQDYLLVCDDLNMMLNSDLDSFNYINISNPKSRQRLLETMSSHSLSHVFRFFYPNVKRYTWRQINPIKQARSRLFLASGTLTDLIKICKINQGYRSDHFILELNLILNPFQRGQGLWKFNCNLLQKQDCIDIVQDAIKETKQRYAIPVYFPEFIETVDALIIDENIFLEMLLLCIREITIKYSISQKKLDRNTEEKLTKDIENIEINCNIRELFSKFGSKTKGITKLKE